MKKLLLLAMISFVSVAQTAPQADPEIVQELKDFCVEVASEDGTGDMSMEQFLLECVNQELESEGYATLKKLP